MSDTEWHKDSGKPRLDLLPPVATMLWGQVMAFGAGKYGDRNWEDYGDEWKTGQLLGSALRHIFKVMAGQDIDKESGLPHMAHVMANAGMFLELWWRGQMINDRTQFNYSQEQRDAIEFMGRERYQSESTEPQHKHGAVEYYEDDHGDPYNELPNGDICSNH